MFRAAELGRKVDKEQFEEAEAELRVRLLSAQRALRLSDAQVIVIVSGVEGAGKTEVVNRLSEWLDTRGLQTHSFWEETDEERRRPHAWRFWRRMPPRGSIGLLFGSWYTQPIIDRAHDRISTAEYDDALRRIREFERLLADDGTVIIKLWFHIGADEQKRRIKQARKFEKAARKAAKTGDPVEAMGKAANHPRVSPLAEKFAKKYKHFTLASEHAVRATDTGSARWYVVESTDRNHRDLSAGNILAAALERRLARSANGNAGLKKDVAPVDSHYPRITVLDQVDLGAVIDRSDYKKRLRAAQNRLYELTWEANRQGRATVLAFEGWDAAGKGGAIRRLTAAMDARLYRVIPIAAPTDEERAQHYLWRFWRHLPPDGRIRIYDRSWYGRVLVERVEGFATFDEWRRAFHEINAFEEQLHRHGVTVLKFWLHISKEEQLARFKAREQIPWKQHKITEEDWRNREKWDDYRAAIHDMVARTSTSYAPWTIVAGNDKRTARVAVVEKLCEHLATHLE